MMQHLDRSPTEPKKSREDFHRSAILRFLEQKIVSKHYHPTAEDADVEADIREYLQKVPARDRAEILYEKLMAYVTDRQAQERGLPPGEQKPAFEPEKDLVTEIKVLLEDQNTKQVFADTYATARVDALSYRTSDIRKRWEEVNDELEDAEGNFNKVERKLFLKESISRSDESTAKSTASRLANRILGLKDQKENIRSLNLPTVEAVPENADAAAMFQYETFKKYQGQLKESGFIWLPSRLQLHRRIIGALQNGRWPVLVGEAGTGKSELADAAALELTGEAPLEIECEATTNVKQLIGDIAIDASGQSYMQYGPLMQAYTGFDSSLQKSPSVKHGRIARFDESGRLGTKAYAVIKKARQESAGGMLYGKPVLPGAAAIWTTNPVGPRYPDRHDVDPAMQREIADIHVDYPEQTPQQPELFEAMVTGLLDENGHISVAESELAPSYVKKVLADDRKRELPDGRIVVGHDELNQDPTAEDHGTLWRLANAIKAVQDAFNYGNNPNGTPHPDGALRMKAVGDDIVVGSEGEPLTLSTSTITIGEALSWMSGFRNRLQKQDKSFQVESFSDWIQVKLNTYINHVKQADRDKVYAIFDHFHLLEGAVGRPRSGPITPKRIGYLSPRVPRPLYVEKPVVAEIEKPTEHTPENPAALYETIEVMLDTGERILIRKGDGTFKTPISDEYDVKAGKPFRIGTDDVHFVGSIQAGNKPVGSFIAEPDLHKVFKPEDLERHQFDYDIAQLEKDVVSLCDLTRTEA